MRRASWWLVCALLPWAGCRWLTTDAPKPTTRPSPAPVPTPHTAALMAKGRALFDQSEYEAAAAAFEEAAGDPATAREAAAFLERTEVLLGRRPAAAWRVDPSRAGDPEMALRITVEVRWLLGEARRLMAAGHPDEADRRITRAMQLIQEADLQRPPPRGQ